ncbi:MAG TPA: hypothetical protein VHX42_01565 [Candidatus Babeliales bacterium]|jgi:hypothetical protein|nr:hypothetical protein [Candidatus Babeliales bacterium]
MFKTIIFLTLTIVAYTIAQESVKDSIIFKQQSKKSEKLLSNNYTNGTILLTTIVLLATRDVGIPLIRRQLGQEEPYNNKDDIVPIIAGAVCAEAMILIRHMFDTLYQKDSDK